jgi:hypothetical protein
MDAVAKMKDSVSDTSIHGHHYVCAILMGRDHVIPWGIRLYVKPEQAKALGLPFQKTTELAAQLIRECRAPAGVKVVVLFDADYLCGTVVQACRQQGCHVASTLKSHRSLDKQGWKLTAGRYGKNLFRRHRTATLVRVKPQGSARDCFFDAGWLEVSQLGLLHVVFSRKGQARKVLGCVTDAPECSAAGLIQADEQRWGIEPCVKDAQQLWGLGQYQNRPYRAAVIHRHLVCFASALLTHLRMMRHGVQGQPTRKKAAGMAAAAAQDAIRALVWDDLVTDLKEQHHGEEAITELERLRTA